jgi:hypothetical protein
MDPFFVYATAGVIAGLVLSQVFRKRFDPFAPIWLFLAGYTQVYVIQALSYREYALRVRGPDLVASANLRALWALCWFLAAYYAIPGRWIARKLPEPPRRWSSAAVGVLTPFLVVWGLFCAGLALQIRDREPTGEETLLQSFPLVLLVAGILLIVTGRNAEKPRPAWTAAGLFIGAFYVLIWMFNGKRSHSLFGVLTTLCAYYVPRFQRPSKPVLAASAIAGMLAVSLAIGWRGNENYERTFSGFFEFVGDFDPSNILVNLNLKDRNEVDPTSKRPASYETEEYGGFLLMMDTVPEKSEYDYGTPYIRLVSTFIPRIVWPEKPYFGREQWVNAWIAGSEFNRDTHFTGPAISILGALQLNGGATATILVLALLAALLRSGYEYFRLYPDVPWVQAWWALTYYNAWLMTVNDDPFVWFYYNYGFTTFIPLTGLWLYLKLSGGCEPAVRLAYA